jgi:mono/diheme cytochrome c family protein
MRYFLVAGVLALSLASESTAQTAFSPSDERVEDLPPGEGRAEAFGFCTACHGFKLVSSQGMTRRQWDETLNWMTERHGMPPIRGAERDLVLDYIAQHYPQHAPSRAGGFRNPFAPQ